MKPILIVIIVLLYLNTVEETDARRKKHKSPVSDDALFEMFGSSTLSKFNPLNCFSLQKGLAALIDKFLVEKANGTKPLKVKFHLTTRSHPERITLKKGSSFSLDNVDFDVTKRTVVIVHGFMSSGDEIWLKDMATAFLEWDDVNVIVVDWSHAAATYNYIKAAVNTRTAGDIVATFFGQVIMARAHTVSSGTWGELHFIGHSLGAHIVGYAARNMLERGFEWTVSRVTGLDPAQPCFRDAAKELRLTKSSAPFVDVIHTNGRTLLKFGLGMSKQVGHLDFYPNGGEYQPSCIKIKEYRLVKFVKMFIPNGLLELKSKIDRMICSHGMSYLYFTDSLRRAKDVGCMLLSFKWNRTWDSLPSSLNPRNVCLGRDCVEMGIQAERFRSENHGQYFTITGQESPYCEFDNQSKDTLESLVKKATKEKDDSSE